MHVFKVGLIGVALALSGAMSAQAAVLTPITINCGAGGVIGCPTQLRAPLAIRSSLVLKMYFGVATLLLVQQALLVLQTLIMERLKLIPWWRTVLDIFR